MSGIDTGGADAVYNDSEETKSSSSCADDVPSTKSKGVENSDDAIEKSSSENSDSGSIVSGNDGSDVSGDRDDDIVGIDNDESSEDEESRGGSTGDDDDKDGGATGIDGDRGDSEDEALVHDGFEENINSTSAPHITTTMASITITTTSIRKYLILPIAASIRNLGYGICIIHAMIMLWILPIVNVNLQGTYFYRGLYNAQTDQKKHCIVPKDAIFVILGCSQTQLSIPPTTSWNSH